MFWLTSVETACDTPIAGDELQDVRADAIARQRHRAETRHQERQQDGPEAARRKFDRTGQAEGERALDVGGVGPKTAPRQLNAVTAAQEDRNPERRRQALGRERRQCGAHHALRRQRSEPEDEERVEQKIQHHGSEHDYQRRSGFADTAHQCLKHGVDEDEDDADKGHPHEDEGAGMDIGRDTQQIEQQRRHRVARGAKNRRGDRHHQHGLGRDMIDQVLPSCAHVLRRQRRAGDAEPRPQRDDQEGDGKTDRHGRDGGRA